MNTESNGWAWSRGWSVVLALAMSVLAQAALGAIAITSPNQATFTAGQPNTFTVTTSGTPTPTIIRRGKKLPAGVLFVDNGNGTGTLSGNPTGAGGNTSFRFVAQSSGGKDTQNFTLHVNAPPTITSANSTTCAVNVFCSFTVTSTGTPTPSIARTGDALPSGMTYVPNANGTGTLSGTPAGGTDGNYALVFTASNGVIPDAVQNFTLHVNRTLAITSAAAKTCVVGASCTFTFTATGIPTPTISITGGTLPSSLSFVDNGNGTASLSGVADAGTGGVHHLVITASNSAESDAVQNFDLTLNEAPAITSSNSQSCAIGVNCAFTVTTTGYPVPAIAQTGDTLPLDVQYFDNGDGTGAYSGIPTAGTAGTYHIVFTASNGIGSNGVQNFTLTVNPSLAVTSANTTTCIVGTPCTFNFTTNGVPTPSVALTGDPLPPTLSYADNADGTGTLSGTANVGTGGTYNLTVTAHNGFESDAVQSFTLSVVQAPAITSASSKTCQETVSCNVTVTTTGFPAPAITPSGDPFPGALNFADQGDGTAILSGSPNPGTHGTYHIVLTASNGVGTDATQNFTLTVVTLDPPTAPLGVSALSGNTQAVVSFSPPLSDGGSAIDSYTATCTPLAGPPGVAIAGATSPITVTGLTNGVTYTCTVHAHNVNGDSPESAASNPVTPSAAGAATLTVQIKGSGAGSVSSLPTGVNCPGTCAPTYPAGTGVVLTAATAGGSTFVGWLGGGCGFSATCTVSVNAATTVTAYFALTANLNAGLANLDIDFSGAPTKYDALTDGLLAIRAMFGLTGNSVTNGALGVTATRTTAADILGYITDISPALDVDGNGQVDALTDGLMVVRYLFGLRGASLIQGAIGAGATRTTSTAIENFLTTVTP